MNASALELIIPIAGIVAVLFALWLARDVLSRDTGTDAMRDVAGTIYEGAIAFIRRQYSTIAGLAVIGAVVLGHEFLGIQIRSMGCRAHGRWRGRAVNRPLPWGWRS